MKNYNILKKYSLYIFYVGSGNYWYEDNNIGNDRSTRYRVYSGALFLVYGMMTVLEILAALRGDFPDEEQRDAVTFAVAHTIVMIKILSVTTKKKFIKSLNRKMVMVCENYEDEFLMAEKYKIMRMNVIAYFVIVYGSVACFICEGLRKLHDGSHFVTAVTYYPSFSNDSFPATLVRVFTTVVLIFMMITMIVSVDTFTVAHLIIYKYKLITLRHYFEDLREEFDRDNKTGNQNIAAENLAIGLVEGIQMHNDLMGLLKDVDKAFGTVMALQVCQSSGTAVSLLLQIAVSNRIVGGVGTFCVPEFLKLSDQLTFVATMKIIFFVVALFFLLAVFLCNAGEITYQASLLSDAIFYCGWHACPPQTGTASRHNVRSLVQLAVMRAQRPLLMKAFNMLQLTYATFIQVLRATYSVFALFYAQNK